MGSTDESFNTGYEPKSYFFTETYVEFNQEPTTEQRFLEDVDYDDAAIGEMLFNAYREQVYHSQREGLSVGQSSSSLSDRTVQPVVETGREVNPEHAQMSTLLDRQREQILTDCQAESRKHEFQADYDRRRKQKFSETIESQQEELHRAQAEELHRRDQPLHHLQFLKQNWIFVKLKAEAHKRSTSMSPTVSTMTVKSRAAKDFCKSETEMVDVMDTLQHAISIIAKDLAKNCTSLPKGNYVRNTNYVMAALIMM